MTDGTVMKALRALISNDEEEKKIVLAELAGGAVEGWEKFLKLNDGEIARIPQEYRKLFRGGKLRAYMRERRRGGSINYEVRCRMGGLCIYAGGTTKEEAREKFIEKLNAGETQKKSEKYKDFCLFYFEKFRKRKVSSETYRCDLGRCERHIFPAIGDKPVGKITPTDCQNILDKLTEKGMGKTADEVFSLMNVVFKGAIAHGLIARNPLSTVVHSQHEREHGKALTKAQEAVLAASASPYRVPLLIALYTGLRPNEYATLRREDDMLIAKNSKRKGGRVEYKRIPVNPMLRAVIGDMKTFDFPMLQTLYKNLRKILGCSLYDLRTTFYTRCRECGVADAARDEMVGHSGGRLADAYTDLSDAFLMQEANKISYTLT